MIELVDSDKANCRMTFMGESRPGLLTSKAYIEPPMMSTFGYYEYKYSYTTHSRRTVLNPNLDIYQPIGPCKDPFAWILLRYEFSVQNCHTQRAMILIGNEGA